jgi:hypothetical protein
LCHQHGSADVEVVHGGKIFQRYFTEGFHEFDTGIIDQDIYFRRASFWERVLYPPFCGLHDYAWNFCFLEVAGYGEGMWKIGKLADSTEDILGTCLAVLARVEKYYLLT